jgi:hypothetical protein
LVKFLSVFELASITIWLGLWSERKCERPFDSFPELLFGERLSNDGNISIVIESYCIFSRRTTVFKMPLPDSKYYLERAEAAFLLEGRMKEPALQCAMRDIAVTYLHLAEQVQELARIRRWLKDSALPINNRCP